MKDDQVGFFKWDACRTCENLQFSEPGKYDKSVCKRGVWDLEARVNDVVSIDFSALITDGNRVMCKHYEVK